MKNLANHPPSVRTVRSVLLASFLAIRPDLARSRDAGDEWKEILPVGQDCGKADSRNAALTWHDIQNLHLRLF